MMTRPTLMTPGRVIIRFLTILLLSFFLVTPFNRAAQPSESSKTPTLEDAKPHNMPWGSYSNHVTDEGLKNPFITGVMLTVSWGQIQPDSEKDFKWSKVDEELNKAKAAGKDVTLVLHAGGRHTPGWVKHTPGIQLISIVDTNIYNKKSYCQPVTVPVFWDPIFLEKKKKYIAEAGKRYGTNPNISGVIVSFANFMTDDWNVPHRADDSGGECGKKFDQIRQWKDAGYTTEKMFNAGKETIDAWAAAFPGKALKLPLHLTHKGLEDDKDGTPPTGSKLAVKITQYGYERYPDRFYVQINWLSAKTPQATDPKVTGADPDSHLYI
jgi:hypothetical protein